MAQSGPWELKPTRQSILFDGKYISLLGLARTQGLDQSWLSRIFSGERQPSLAYARKVSAALGMGLEAFLDTLDQRTAGLRARNKRIISQYDTRLKREKAEDDARLKAGRPRIPRIPLLKKIV